MEENNVKKGRKEGREKKRSKGNEEIKGKGRKKRVEGWTNGWKE